MSAEVCDRTRCHDLRANHVAGGPCRAAGCTCPGFTDPRQRLEDDAATVRGALDVLTRRRDDAAPALATALARIVTDLTFDGGDDFAAAPGNRLSRLDVTQ